MQDPELKEARKTMSLWWASQFQLCWVLIHRQSHVRESEVPLPGAPSVTQSLAWLIVMLPVCHLNRLKMRVPEVAKSKWFSRTVICTLFSFALLSGNWNHCFKQSEGQRQLKSCCSRETKGMAKDPGVKIFQNNLPFFIFFCSCFKWNGKYLIFKKKNKNSNK